MKASGARLHGWGEGLGMKGRTVAIMNRRGSMNRRSRRDPEAIAFARDQRARANELAQDVWQTLCIGRCRNQKFRREYPIPPYTVDFCCVALKLIIEVDGEHHQNEEGCHHDQRRDQCLAEQGYRIVRIAGYEVLRNAAAVRLQIEKAVDERVMQQSPSSQPFSPVTKASTTRLRHGGEGRQSKKRSSTPKEKPHVLRDIGCIAR